MATEEKAKAYDEAIERAKMSYHTGDYDKDTLEMLEIIFPELKESEDEKARKEIVTYLKSVIANKGYRDKIIESWIAWLEKLGKCEIDYPQNHQDSSYPNGCIVLEDFNGGEGFYKVHLDYLNKKQVEEVEEMVRMWNKESKTSNRNIKNCIEMCLADANEQRFKDYGTNLKDCLSWLEKQGEQKPAWSEEDENMLEDTCRILSNSKECTTSNVRWLKSLRPQSQWKPSGFHLECISDAIAMYQERGINAIGLKEILEELKKLKKE